MRAVWLLALCLFSVAAFAEQKIRWIGSPAEIVIDRSEHRLMIKKDGVVLRSFKASFGSGGRKSKQKRGDCKTPNGIYKISDVGDSEKFHLFLELNYPNVRDAVYGLRNDVITKQQYNRILDAHLEGRRPPQNTPLGGQIGIHGIGYETNEKIEIHQIADWTQGCIALRNSEVEALLGYIDVGTTVKIQD
jgi:murein L,D-transpeptidase YafK